MAESLYVHVPFCTSICYYCDFAHVVYQKDLVRKWLDALAFQLHHTAINPKLKTIYVGGGTPGCLDADELETLLQMLDPYRRYVQEYTLECNPESVTAEKAALLVKHGINRVSMGMQSADDRLLTAIGRRHTFADTKNAVSILKQAGIHNISLDLMYSLPQQTMADLQDSIAKAIGLQPTHLSLYSLTIEKNTVFGRKGITPLDEDTEADMYEYICRELPRYGYRQYEISNFCLDGCESKHNLAYWHYDDFYGISCGASGKEGLLRYDNEKNLMRYLQNPLQRHEIPLSRQDAQFEMIMMSLRLKQGLDLSAYQRRFHHAYEEDYGLKTEALIKRGWLEEKDGYVRCSEKGYEICNTVLEELMPEEE
ncbi:MAG: radical SAM family heme chaperone HemW [Lactimicrobium sp.]|jgi:oxygen-independent coproporphyrinogen-3 oxidase|uniref:radical SAM family heme chaperone HemW n=1 Tax=Lactimicrobium sp. TaxID=2563780 RepID=UPI002F3609F0